MDPEKSLRDTPVVLATLENKDPKEISWHGGVALVKQNQRIFSIPIVPTNNLTFFLAGQIVLLTAKLEGLVFAHVVILVRNKFCIILVLICFLVSLTFTRMGNNVGISKKCTATKQHMKENVTSKLNYWTILLVRESAFRGMIKYCSRFMLKHWIFPTLIVSQLSLCNAISA